MSDAEARRWLREEVLPRLQRSGIRLVEAPSDAELAHMRELATPPFDKRFADKAWWYHRAPLLRTWLNRVGLEAGEAQETRLRCGKTAADGRRCVLSANRDHLCRSEFLEPA